MCSRCLVLQYHKPDINWSMISPIDIFREDFAIHFTNELHTVFHEFPCHSGEWCRESAGAILCVSLQYPYAYSIVHTYRTVVVATNVTHKTGVNL